jgi:hypothetical protein
LFEKVKNFIKKYIDDFLVIVGVSSLALGVFLIYIPAGYIVLGLCLIALAFLIARKGG